MCSPTLAFAGLSAFGSILQGSQEAAAANYNAAVARNNAITARRSAAADAAAQRRDTSKLLGSQAAAYGASGVLTEGSPSEVMAETARAGELEALKLLYGGDLEATNQEAQRRMFKQQARNSVLSGFLGAGSALASGYSSWQQSQPAKVPGLYRAGP